MHKYSVPIHRCTFAVLNGRKTGKEGGTRNGPTLFLRMNEAFAEIPSAGNSFLTTESDP